MITNRNSLHRRSCPVGYLGISVSSGPY